MDYHLIFLIVSIVLYLVCTVLIFYKPNKEEFLLAIVLASTNIYFTYVTALGFFQIGLIGVDIATGNATVNGYESMTDFYMIFFGMSIINGAMILYSFLRLMRIKFLEMEEKNYKPKWRDNL